MRSGDILFQIKATFTPTNGPALEQVRRFFIGKPFFRSYLLILCEPLQRLPDRLEVVSCERRQGLSWAFQTSLELCADILSQHGRSCSEVLVALEQYKTINTNSVQLLHTEVSAFQPVPSGRPMFLFLLLLPTGSSLLACSQLRYCY